MFEFLFFCQWMTRVRLIPLPTTLKKHRQTLRHRGSPTHRHPPGYISLESARPSSPRINSWIFSRRCEDEWNFSEVFLFLIDSMTNNLFPVCYEWTPPCRDTHTVFSYLSRIGFCHLKHYYCIFIHRPLLILRPSVVLTTSVSFSFNTSYSTEEIDLRCVYVFRGWHLLSTAQVITAVSETSLKISSIYNQPISILIGWVWRVQNYYLQYNYIIT